MVKENKRAKRKQRSLINYLVPTWGVALVKKVVREKLSLKLGCLQAKMLLFQTKAPAKRWNTKRMKRK